MIFFAETDKGKRRRMNQDYVYGTDQPIGALDDLFLLADGMGGHKAGDYASRYLVEELKKYFANTSSGPVVRLLQKGIESINAELYMLSRENESLSGMGTTLVAAVIEQEVMTVANIGDSRCYLIHGNTIRQITRDHSYVEEMVERGMMRRGSPEYLRARNIITRAVGIEPTVEADFFEIDLSEGDFVLLCSDGLFNMVDNESILSIVRDDSSIQDKGRALIDMANINGGRDNIGVVLIDPFHKEVTE
ncbi:Stp1/IreP family PP2C-type Ser/Thr phosphatase [Oribacterium sp. HCP28S3_H8]|uniref:Stp1/IreP family PP2C-type Ser/Thr phosphatase n=1 Tax=Oribacterium sp. HCP28S3_H8 TaxID=3438945 RepID=UPI003F894D3F